MGKEEKNKNYKIYNLDVVSLKKTKKPVYK